MKEKIQELIELHKNSKNEVFMLLEELNQIDITKLDYIEEDSLKETKLKYQEEYAWRGVFISSLEDLL